MWALSGSDKIDHSRFRGFGVDLAYGLRRDELLHVSDVPRGLACDCVCPACRARLKAHKGPKKAHHFAHHELKKSCTYAAETNAHIWAKAVLLQVKTIWLPPITARIDGKLVVLRKKERFNFDHVTSEKKLGGIVPDIVLSAGTRRLIVEVFVTHKCDAEKIRKIQDLDLSAIEVDLSQFRSARGDDETENQKVRRALLWVAPRAWLYNSRLPELVEKRRRVMAEQSLSNQEPTVAPPAALQAPQMPTTLMAKLTPTAPPLADSQGAAPVAPAETARHVGVPATGSTPPYLPRWVRSAWRWILSTAQ